MSTSTLLNLAGGLFLLLPVGHTQMYFQRLRAGLNAAALPGYAGSVSWSQANGYFITTALLCFKWAQQGGVPTGIERWIFATLLATQLLTGAAYLRKGVAAPPLAYGIGSALMIGGYLKGI
ncbi:hypothetical protein B0O99DRAFT_604831 [Bisporella sp. PMI_857]|nr:hypothetical protein B0O99DRAFT_604831 [Bisporella sp. PMI_857]